MQNYLRLILPHIVQPLQLSLRFYKRSKYFLFFFLFFSFWPPVSSCLHILHYLSLLSALPAFCYLFIYLSLSTFFHCPIRLFKCLCQYSRLLLSVLSSVSVPLAVLVSYLSLSLQSLWGSVSFPECVSLAIYLHLIS
jgi:hypothetical protein